MLSLQVKKKKKKSNYLFKFERKTLDKYNQFCLLWSDKLKGTQSKEGRRINGLEGMTCKESLDRLNMYSLTNQQLSGGGGQGGDISVKSIKKVNTKGQE